MQRHVRAVVDAIEEGAWQRLEEYPDSGVAEIAETRLGSQRLVVRRVRLVGPDATLFPDWRHFAFLTNRVEALELVEREHRQHPVVEFAIRDLKIRRWRTSLRQVQRQRRLGP